MPEPPFQKVWEVGEVLTAADLNTNVRDGWNYPLKDKPQARGTIDPGLGEQVIANGTWTNINFSVQQYDTTDNTFEFVDRFDIKVPGLYLVTGIVSFNPNSTGGRAMRFTIDSGGGAAPYNGIASSLAGPADQHTAPSMTRLIYLPKTAILRLQGFQTSGGNLGINNAFSEGSALQVVWVSSDTIIR